MINYRLEVFRRVAELQNITKAARVLHISQPAVTKHIKLLEETLQIPLFVRSGKGMALTEAGLVYLQHVQQIAKAHENVLRQLRAPADVLTGHLRIGCNQTVLSYYLPRMLGQFKTRHPAVICDIMDGNTDTIIGALLDQRLDLALIEGPCRRPEIQIRTFLEDEIIWVASPHDPLAKKKHHAVADILSRPLIVRETGAGGRQFMEQALQQLRIPLAKLKIIQEIPSPEAIKRLIAEGLGIGYVFRLGVEPELALGKLIKLNCPKLNIRRPFSLLFPQGPQPAGITHAFAQTLLNAGKTL